MDEAADKAVEDADVTADAVDVTLEAPEQTAEAADAYDEAVLELIALEMAAPDPPDIGGHEATDGYEIDVGEVTPAEPIALPASPPPEPIIVAERPERIAAPAVQPRFEPSLGSTLIANGILRSRHASASDPLAPIRRLSQIEKIAFFS